MTRKSCVLFRMCEYSTLAVVLVCFIWPLTSSAQNRLSDKDVEKIMENLKDDAGKFRSSFNSAIGKTSLRNTDQEKQSKSLVERFQKETEDLWKHFNSNKGAEADLKNVRESAAQIDQLIRTTPMGNEVAGNWDKVKGGLENISKAFGLDSPF
jgi:hypothetical protein